MKKLFTILFLLLTAIGFGQTLTTPTSQEVPVGVNGIGIGGFSLTGYNSSSLYKVSLCITGNANGTFSVNTTLGLTLDYGFNSWTNITMVNFVGTPASIQNALNSIKLNTTSTLDGLINLSVVITSQVTNTYYNPDNGHMYKFVPGSISVTNARNNAKASSFEGESGYLVNITSAAEQSFINNKVSAQNVWIGLTDAASEGTWKWMDGPEAGQTATYTNWCNSEPNDWSSGEDYVVTKWYGDSCWNDYGPPATTSTFSIGGYIIEYGTWTDPTQSTFNSTQQTQITFTQKEMLWVDYEFDFSNNIDPTDFSGKMYYEESTNSWATNNTTDLTLNSSGNVNVTNQIQETAVGKKGTTVGGSVEWCVIYNRDATNNRYRVGIDKREFPSGFDFTKLTRLQLFDLYDGVAEYKSDDSAWAEYYIPATTNLNWSGSSYGSYLRDGGGYQALKAEFSFDDVMGYEPQSFIFNSPSQTEIETLIDDVVTVTDVVLAFNELAGGGLNGGYKGDLNGIQLGNADVNGDSNFDFQDTYKLLEHLTGTNPLVQSTNTLVYFMKIKTKTDWDATTTSNWKSKYNGTTLMADVDVDENNLIQFPKYKVTWVGDINLSHSPTSTGAVTTAKVNSAPRLMTSRNQTNSVDVMMDVEMIENKIVVTLTLPENQKNIIGSEFRIGFDNTRVTYDKLETTSNLQNFDAERTEYIKLGSISTDGSKNLNGGVEYKIYFSPQQNFNSILGLVSIIKSELVTTNGEQVGVKIK